MKAIGPRIERLYEEEAQRWRSAWERFFDVLWKSLRQDEGQALDELIGLAADDPIQPQLVAAYEAFCEEAGVTVEKEGGPFTDFVEAFWRYVPDLSKKPDLTRWPEGVPRPPEDEDPEEVSRLARVCRRRKTEGRAERLAAAHLLGEAAVVHTARLYARRRT